MSILPSETFAVVVGIESYAGGTNWDLDGPASDAARFARWVRRRGVPADNLAVFASPLEKNNQLEWPDDRTPEPATSGAFDHLLHDTLRERKQRLLMLFWGGHGVLQGGETRRLFYADARAHNRVNLDFNRMLGLLRGDQWPKEIWPRQIIMVDACANLAEREGWREALPDAGYSVGHPLASREQFALLAAQAGEYAANLDAEQTGLFSRELLAELERRPTDEWPPDMEAIRQTLVTRFESLRAQGLAWQSPAYLWNRDWQANLRTFGQFAPPPPVPVPAAASPRLIRLDRPDKAELRDALLACPSMQRSESREDVRLQLSPDIAHSVPHRSDARAHTLHILETCLAFPGGLAQLFEVVHFFDSGRAPVEALEAALRRIAPATLPPAP